MMCWQRRTRAVSRGAIDTKHQHDDDGVTMGYSSKGEMVSARNEMSSQRSSKNQYDSRANYASPHAVVVPPQGKQQMDYNNRT